MPEGTWQGAGSGAATGATVGTLLGGPVVGLIGAGIGGAAGLIGGGKWAQTSRHKDYRKQRTALADEMYGGEANLPAHLQRDNFSSTHAQRDALLDEYNSGGGQPQMSDAERKALEAQTEYYGVASKAAKEQMARATEMWNVYKNEYLPGELAIAKESFAGIPTDPELAYASQDVSRSFDRSKDIGERNLERMGINPASPQYQALQANYGIARAAAKAGARNETRRNIRDVNYGRRMAAANMGKGIPAQASGMTASGAGIMGSAATGLANTYNAMANREFQAKEAAAARQFSADQAHRARQSAKDSNTWGAIGDLIGGVASAAGMYYGMKGMGGGGGGGIGSYVGGGADPTGGGDIYRSYGNALA